VIRQAIKEDCINLAALSIEVWLGTYAVDGINKASSKFVLSTFTEKYFTDLLLNKNFRLLLEIEGPYLRGYTLLNLQSFYQSEENGFEIDKLYVQEQFQGRGIGRKLLSEVERQFGNKFWLHSWVHNKSINFYKKLGFIDIGRYDFEFDSEIIENRVLAFNGMK
jgi:diamine N-acetyltransferase